MDAVLEAFFGLAFAKDLNRSDVSRLRPAGLLSVLAVAAGAGLDAVGAGVVLGFATAGAGLPVAATGALRTGFPRVARRCVVSEYRTP